MDPNGIAPGGDKWLDNQDLSPYGMDGKGFVHVIIKNDGTKTIEVYRYGTDGAIKTIDAGYDEDQRKRWDSQVKQANPANTTESVSAPTNAPNIVTRGPGGTTVEPNPNYTPPPSEPPKEKDEGGRRWIWNTKTNKWEDVGPAPMNAGERQAATFEQQTQNQKQAIAIRAMELGLKLEDVARGEMVKGPDGKMYQLRPRSGDPTSLELLEIPGQPGAVGPGAPGSWRPDPSKEAYGLYERRDELSARTKLDKADPNYLTPEQFKDLLKQDYDLVTMQRVDVQNRDTLLSNQRTQNISQRGQDLNDVSGRRTYAQNIFETAARSVGAGNAYLPKGSDAGGRAFLAMLNMGQQYAQSMGGLRDVPAIPQAELSINGIGTLKIPMSQSAGAAQQANSGIPTPNMTPSMDTAPAAPPPPTPDYGGVQDTLRNLGIDDDTIGRAAMDSGVMAG